MQCAPPPPRTQCRDGELLEGQAVVGWGWWPSPQECWGPLWLMEAGDSAIWLVLSCHQEGLEVTTDPDGELVGVERLWDCRFSVRNLTVWDCKEPGSLQIVTLACISTVYRGSSDWSGKFS